MNTPHAPFLWPDRVIGKRESRRIRDAHNALYNDYHKAIEALESTLEAYRLARSQPFGTDAIEQTARAEIAKLQTVMRADPEAFANIEPPAVSPTLDR